ncbi:hypothetical protein EVAR_60712_1 [Eumeta japonica]|uniref:Uncharacterized protein n=1 Tax=Eumeta variegata TaxID=151549 RepID=A0A4C1Z7U1_EUMVA|nr:hypothetical protein EVAR_60712_1 [Eumeta japonica]
MELNFKSDHLLLFRRPSHVRGGQAGGHVDGLIGRKNSDIRVQCGLKEDVVIRAERGVLQRFDHLERMNGSRPTEQIYRANVCERYVRTYPRDGAQLLTIESFSIQIPFGSSPSGHHLGIDLRAGRTRRRRDELERIDGKDIRGTHHRNTRLPDGAQQQRTLLIHVRVHFRAAAASATGAALIAYFNKRQQSSRGWQSMASRVVRLDRGADCTRTGYRY